MCAFIGSINLPKILVAKFNFTTYKGNRIYVLCKSTDKSFGCSRIALYYGFIYALGCIRFFFYEKTWEMPT